MGIINQNITPFVVSAEELTTLLRSNVATGLSSSEAQRRLKIYGLNAIAEKKDKSPWLIFYDQFKSPIALLLVAAASFSFYFGEWLDGIAILTVLVINALVGFYMEYQADRSMKALKKLSSIPAKVLRDSHLEEINAQLLVPGDIVYFEAGDIIPADGRMVHSSQVQMDESSLTGESIPVEKQIGVLTADTALAERNNMVYKGSFSSKGNGYVVVTATGEDTELGRIAQMVRSAEQSATPLEKKLENFSRKLIWITVVLAVIIFITGLLNGQGLVEILKTSIALGVAAIPEGLPIVATLALARGMIKMAKHNVIVKKLSAVETLGGTNVICTDKTGTLTQNKIEVSEIITAADNSQGLGIMNRIAALCSTAELQYNQGVVKEIGDPLETGLLKFVLKNNIDIANCRKQFPKLKEEPFSSETKIMSTLHQAENGLVVYSKGAAEELLARCNRILERDGIIELNAGKREYWINQVGELANSGLRVIAGAYKPATTIEGDLATDLVFAGLFGMIDPPRAEVFGAIEECKMAGIDVIMVTGDHPATANNIALKLGISDGEASKTITGKDMRFYDQLSDQEKSMWIATRVFARVSPRQKLDLVSVLQERKCIVGMTGDGVNDAPALKKADIGIAMGIRGTQVSQEVADMILKDDSFRSIVIAIKQGRIIFENIRKFVVYLLSCNMSELLVIATAAILNLHFQLFALQILFINLVTDVLPALALSATDGAIDIMRRPPRNVNEPIIDRNRWVSIFFYAFVIGAMSIGAVFISHLTVHKTEVWNPELCNNILFFTLIFSQLLHVFNMGNDSSFFHSEVIRNKFVLGAILISTVVLIAIYAVDPLSRLLSIYPMSISDWLIIAAASLLSTILIYLGKVLGLAKQ